MEILFENIFVRDKKTAKEIYGYWFFKKPTMVAMYSILAAYATACIVGLIIDFESAKESAFPLFCALLLPVLMIISYSSQVKMMVDRDKEMGGGEGISCHVTVTDSELTLTAFDGKNSVSVDNIKYAFLTKNYIVIVTKARLMYILKKDSFTIGDSDGFIAFLLKKGVKVRGQKKRPVQK